MFVLLTHAHLDHCGLIPRLYNEGFTGQVYCTSATAKLAKIVMMDCSRILDIYSSHDVGKVWVQFVRNKFENITWLTFQNLTDFL